MELFHACCHAGNGAKLHHSSPEAYPGHHSPPPEEAPTVRELAGPACFLRCQLPSGSLISKAGCGPACYLQSAQSADLPTLVPPFFGETRESPAGTPSPCSWVWGTVAASANKPFVCSQPPHQLIPPTCPNLVFRHICTPLGKISPDTEVKLNFKL